MKEYISFFEDRIKMRVKIFDVDDPYKNKSIRIVFNRI